MGEYIFKGTLDLEGVEFFVEAENEEEALAKAKRGEWASYEISGASSVDCSLDPDTIEENV